MTEAAGESSQNCNCLSYETSSPVSQSSVESQQKLLAVAVFKPASWELLPLPFTLTQMNRCAGRDSKWRWHPNDYLLATLLWGAGLHNNSQWFTSPRSGGLFMALDPTWDPPWPSAQEDWLVPGSFRQLNHLFHSFPQRLANTNSFWGCSCWLEKPASPVATDIFVPSVWQVCQWMVSYPLPCSVLRDGWKSQPPTYSGPNVAHSSIWFRSSGCLTCEMQVWFVT